MTGKLMPWGQFNRAEPPSPAPAESAGPAIPAAPAPEPSPPRQIAGPARSAAPAESAGPSARPLYVRTPHVVYDEILPTLEPKEQAVYNQLFRLSWGHGRDWCKIGMPRLAERTKMGVRTVREAVRALERRRLVSVEAVDYGGGTRRDGGATYRVRVPGFTPADFAGPAGGAGAAGRAGPAKAAAMKENPKEVHESASPEQVRRYAAAALHEYRLHHPDASRDELARHLRAFAEEAGYSVAVALSALE